MKKVLFTIGIIAILVGVAFVGMAASENQGSPPWNSLAQKIDTLATNVTNLQGNISVIRTDLANTKSNVSTIQTELANVTRMETGSGEKNGNATLGEDTWVIMRNNPQVRHVHLTYYFDNENNDYLSSYLYAGVGPYGDTYRDSHADTGYYTVDFDAKYWALSVYNGGTPESSRIYGFRYAWTETYAP